MDEDAVETPKQDTSEGNGVDDKLSTPIVTLPTGLGPSEEEAERVASVFWSEAWPKLLESGWSKVCFTSGVDFYVPF
jgi:hypothetical protein